MFHTTRWSIITDAAEGMSRALEVWSATYSEPMVRFLLKRGFRPEDAEDYVQSFLLKVVADRKVLVAATPTRGRFRNLLLTSLMNHVRSSLRVLKTNISIDAIEGWEPQEEVEAVRQFDMVWALQLFAIALKSWKKECVASTPDVWETFKLRILVPFVQGTASPSWADIASKLQFKDAHQAANRLVSARRGIARHLSRVVHENVSQGVNSARNHSVSNAPQSTRPSSLDRMNSNELEDEIEHIFQEELAHLKQTLISGAKYFPTDEMSNKVDRHSHDPMDFVGDPFHQLLIEEQASHSVDGQLKIRPDHYAFVSIDELMDETHETEQSKTPEQLKAELKNFLKQELPRDSIFLEVGDFKTIGDLLRHHSPALHCIRAVKDFCKSNLNSSTYIESATIMYIVYYAMIAKGLNQGMPEITDLPYQQLQQGFQWVLNQTWIMPELRNIVLQARVHIEESSVQ